jgi:subtilisin family serine protease
MAHPDDRACLQGVLVREDTLSLPEDVSLSPQVKIFQTGFKNPFLARWEPRPGDSAGEPIWAVATNLLVTFRSDVDVNVARETLQAHFAPQPVEIERLPLDNLYHVKSRIQSLPSDGPASYVLSQWRNLNEKTEVLRVSPDYLFFSFPDQASPGPLPSRPPVEREVDLIGAPKVWAQGVSGDGIRVAVLDTGIALEHPALKDNILLDADNKVVGRNFYAGNDDVRDDHFHGTYCSGLIGAMNGMGINKKVSLIPIKFLSSSGCGRTCDAIKGIFFALETGADVISNSWGGAGDSPELKAAIEAANERKVLFVAGAGNGMRFLDTAPYFPAAFPIPNVISVGGTRDDDTPVTSWGLGQHRVHLSAPGVNIVSTVPSAGHEEHSGTSASAALVSGACVLVKAAFPALTYLEVRQRIIDSVAHLQGHPTSASCTNGRLDLANAVLGGNFPRANCP